MMLAGKAAEAHLLGDASTGAADDVRAEAIVRRPVAGRRRVHVLDRRIWQEA